MMVQKIKELRVTIDGLAQLTKGLNPIGFIYDKAGIPDDLSPEEFRILLE